jgi:thiol-disulfide isomerase/thioredoxin
MLRVALYAFVALIALGAGLWASSSRQTAVPSVNSAQVLWALSLPDLNNQPQRLEQWRGKVVVVNFWATWCEPCRKEIPLFVKMQEKHAAKGLQFVGISIDQVDKTSEFARNFKINYPTLIGTFDAVEVSQKAGNQRRGLPFTVILDRKGQIAATELGGVTQEKLDALIAPLL